MNRRNFLKNSMFGIGYLCLPEFADAKIKDIKIEHPKVVREYFGDNIQKISNNYKMPKNLVYGIIGKENGKPFPEFPSGFGEVSKTGFMGLGQQNDSSLQAGVKQAQIIKDYRQKKGEKFESLLNNFEDVSGLLAESIKAPFFDFNGKNFSSAEFQLEGLVSYLHHCESLFSYRHLDLGVISYNIGPSKTVEVFDLVFNKSGISKKSIDEAKKGIFRNFRNEVSKIEPIIPNLDYLEKKYSELGIKEPISYFQEVKNIGKIFS